MEQEDDARQPAPAMPPWGHCFKRTGTDEPATIELTQLDVKLFRLQSSLTYVGPSSISAPRRGRPDEPADDRPDVGARADALVRQPVRPAHAGRAAARPARRRGGAGGVPARRRRPPVPRHARRPRRAAAAPLPDVGRRRLRHTVVGGRAAPDRDRDLVRGRRVRDGRPWRSAWRRGRCRGSPSRWSCRSPPPCCGASSTAAACSPPAAGRGSPCRRSIAALGYGIYWLLESTLQLLPITPERRDPAPPKDF